MKKGIDVSVYQKNVDYNKVKSAGIDYVIVRAGYGKYISQKDPLFETHYKNAKAAGLNVGCYWYSYADSVADAKLEAQICIQAIKGKTFEYPVYFDLEERKQFNKGQTFCDSITTAFCNTLEAAGYWAGLYISRSPLQQYISSSVANRYALWVAEYNSKCNYSGTYGMWQYSSTGKVNGVNGNIDMDYSYIDYPEKIKAAGKNGFNAASSNTTKPVASTAKKKSNTTIANEVIAGKWGNGSDRKNKLTAAGYDYDAVQKIVDQKMSKKSNETIANEVIKGLWGNGADREKKLKAAGYDYNAIQKIVNSKI